MLRAANCRRRPRTPWSSNALVQPMWWAREELTSDFFRVRSTEDFATGIRDRLGIVRNRAETAGQRRCRHGAWLMIRHGSFAPVPVPPDGVCCPSAAATGPLTPSTPPCRRVVSHHVVASAGSVLGGPCSRSAAPCCRQGAPAHVRDVLSQPGRTRIMRNPGLQLLEDLVQPSIWTVCGKQHR